MAPNFSCTGRRGRSSSVRRYEMGSFSVWHWILVLAVGLLLFGGRGKVSELMGDFAKGIKSFKKRLAEDENPEPEPGKADQMRTIDHQAAPTAAQTPAETKAG